MFNFFLTIFLAANFLFIILSISLLLDHIKKIQISLNNMEKDITKALITLNQSLCETNEICKKECEYLTEGFTAISSDISELKNNLTKKTKSSKKDISKEVKE